MKLDKEKIEALKIKFPVRFNRVHMFLVDRQNVPLLQMMGYAAAHGQYMANRGLWLAELLNQVAGELGLMPEPVQVIVPDENVVPEVPQVEKVNYKKRGRGRPRKVA